MENNLRCHVKSFLIFPFFNDIIVEKLGKLWIHTTSGYISNSFPSATNICFSRFQAYATTNPTWRACSPLQIFKMADRPKREIKKAKRFCNEYTPPLEWRIHGRKIQNCTILRSGRLKKSTTGWKFITLAIAHASMNGDLRGRRRIWIFSVCSQRKAVHSIGKLSRR